MFVQHTHSAKTNFRHDCNKSKISLIESGLTVWSGINADYNVGESKRF